MFAKLAGKKIYQADTRPFDCEEVTLNQFQDHVPVEDGCQGIW
jgi:hypothetical protein